MSLTEIQGKAVTLRGNVLVVAGAGTGKTHTLVERCLACLVAEKPRVSLDEILMVTFTEAAAAEMRRRIRKRLEEELASDPGQAHWHEQLALFETSHIGTLHSFCLKLVREHFYQLELDPQLSVLADEEARLLADETLDELLQKHYAGRGPEALAVQQLIQSQGRGWDKPIRALILRLHHYTQTLPDPGGWVKAQLAIFSDPAPRIWRQWLMSAANEWRSRWREALKRLGPGNDIAARCALLLDRPGSLESRAQAATLLDELAEAGKDCPYGKKTLWLKPLQRFFEETRFLSSLANLTANNDPLAEDWNWVRTQMSTLLGLAAQFTHGFTEAKHELGVVDFHDLEQHALRLLWDPVANQPTPIARQWRKKLRFVFVDEYQDINAAQDKIIQALSRDGAQANRFLVGDVKQSIYRFRLANPRIFQDYVRSWTEPHGTTIALVENFRSREALLRFVNSLFSTTMRSELGGVVYDQQAQLSFGSPTTRAPLRSASDAAACVELHLRVKNQNDDLPDSEPGADLLAEVRDLDEADKEARLVGMRLRELRAAKGTVWDETTGEFRRAEWRDMAILLRSPAGKVESYAKEFARLGVPLQVIRGGFYESLEISDLVSLLQVLDNPLQDIPVLAVLHSPLVGLTINELADLRLASLRSHFWTALVRWADGQKTAPAELASRRGNELKRDSAGTSDTARPTPADGQSQTGVKVALFLERFSRWRRLARQVSLSRCLEAVLSETHYAEWLLTQSRGDQRQANVQRLVGLAQQFDQFQRQGLFRFLRFIEAQQMAEAEPQVAAVNAQDAVRLMSIHQSKGLEFPVVAVADLGKPFNLSDLRSEIILDEQYALCPQINPPRTTKLYPSLPYWLAREHQLKELLGEEMRLLYVALTRARDRLLLSGSVSAARFDKAWKSKREANLDAILAARCYADWMGLWFSHHCSEADSGTSSGVNAWLQWVIHDDSILLEPAPATSGTEAPPGAQTDNLSAGRWKKLGDKLSWQYPFGPATRQPAKASVSELRRRAADQDQNESVFLSNRFRPSPGGFRRNGEDPSETDKAGTSEGGAAEIGTGHHLFLQHVSLEHALNPARLGEEVARLRKECVLDERSIAGLDMENLAAFWASDLGRRIQMRSKFVHRELAFTARFEPREIADLTGTMPSADLEGEFVIVQGVADLVVLLAEEIWLVDFKTDHLRQSELAHRTARYAPQLRIYARALSRIYKRPVSECWLSFLSCRKQESVEVSPREGVTKR